MSENLWNTRLVSIDTIVIIDRMREKHDNIAQDELEKSIQQVGLLHPITLSYTSQLLAGERRLNAVKSLHDKGIAFNYIGTPVPAGTIPANVYQVPLNRIQELEIELDENKARLRFSPVEEAAIVARISKLYETAQGKYNPRTQTGVTQKRISEEIYGDQFSSTSAQHRVGNALLIDRHRDDPAVKAAPTFKKAAVIAKKLETRAIREAINAFPDAHTMKRNHTLYLGDYRTHRKNIPPISVVITDPPYGMGMQDMLLRKASFNREFSDSYETWKPLMQEFCQDLLTLTLPNAYVMLFCAYDRFQELSSFFPKEFIVRNRPVIWFKGNAGVGSTGEYNFPRNTYDCILFARRGDRVLREPIYDVIQQFASVQSVKREQHPDAKPVELLKYLIRITTFPGESLLDPFVGSGQIFYAASANAVNVVACEKESAYYHIALENMALSERKDYDAT